MNFSTSVLLHLIPASITFAVFVTLLTLILRTRIRTRLSANSILLLWVLILLLLIIPFNIRLTTPSPSTHPTTSSLFQIWSRLDPLQYIDWGILEIPALETSARTPGMAKAETVSCTPTEKSSVGITLLTIWLFGFVFVISFYGIQQRGLRRLLRESRPVRTPSLLQVHATLLRQLQIRQSIPLYFAEGIGTAAIVGLFKPRILVCSSITNCSDAQIHSVLLHELTHFRQRHLWINAIALCCTALHWFNPTLWLAYRQLRRAIELACDETVIRTNTSELTPETYAHHLLDLMSQFSSLPSHRLSFLGLFNNIETRFIQQRIVMIKNINNQKLPIMLVLLVGLGCTAAAITHLSPGVDAPPPPPAPPLPPSLSTKADTSKLQVTHIDELKLDFDAFGEEPSFSEGAKKLIKEELLPILQSEDPYAARQRLLESEFANEAPVEFLMGNICLQQNMVAEAEHHYINAMNACPNGYERAFKNLLLIYTTTEHGAEAYPLFGKYLKHASDPSAQVYLMAGVAAMQAEIYEEAVPLFKKAIELDANDSNAKLNLFQVYMTLENFPDAEIVLQDLIRLETDAFTLASYHKYYANVAVALNNPALAAEQLERSLALKPEDSEAAASRKMLKEIYEKNPQLK